MNKKIQKVILKASIRYNELTSLSSDLINFILNIADNDFIVSDYKILEDEINSLKEGMYEILKKQSTIDKINISFLNKESKKNKLIIDSINIEKLKERIYVGVNIINEFNEILSFKLFTSHYHLMERKMVESKNELKEFIINNISSNHLNEYSKKYNMKNQEDLWSAFIKNKYPKKKNETYYPIISLIL